LPEIQNLHPLTKPTQHTVCLIDDDRIYQFTAKKILESTGLSKEIFIFNNGEEAINFFRENSQAAEKLPDIIFLDINMPVMDGWQFLEEFQVLHQDLGKKISIYMVSSSVDDYDIKKSKEYSLVADYVIKPINRERFEQLIHEVE
jgi:CheY-like chemotaxis protein